MMKGYFLAAALTTAAVAATTAAAVAAEEDILLNSLPKKIKTMMMIKMIRPIMAMVMKAMKQNLVFQNQSQL